MALPDANELLALLQRAAEELKVTKGQLYALESRMACEADVTNVTAGDVPLLRARIELLTEELATVVGERETLKAQLKHFEVAPRELGAEGEIDELNRQVRELQSALSQERGRTMIFEPQPSRETRAKLDLMSNALIEHEEELRKEREKHQLAAHELNERRTRVRELEEALAALSAELLDAKNEWQHVENQYEALHRDMLRLLDERDEARRALQLMRPTSIPPLTMS